MKPETNAKRDLRLIGLGDLSPTELRLGAVDISVGSDLENDLVINHPTVSRQHAILGYHAGHYTVADLGSTNGTFVNGSRVQSPIPLQPGDEIGFGAAKFAMVGGGDVVPARRARPPLSRVIGATGGIVLFAIAGFIVTRYALGLQSGQQPAAKPRAEEPSPSNPKVAARETTEAAPEPSSTPATPEVADAEAENPSPAWLKHVNSFRTQANLAPVRGDDKLSDGDRKHATYVLNNFASDIRSGELGAQLHSEDPTRQWYTPEGDAAARASDIAEQGGDAGSKVPDPQQWAIDGWMIGPFHRLFILSPLLHDVGFGSDCDDNACVANLNVLSGADPSPRLGTPMEHPIIFPPEGASIPPRMRALETEWPNPISGCDGYAFPTGIPITMQLGPMVDAQINLFSIASGDGAEVEACGFDANSYRNPDPVERARVIGDLRGQGAIVIVPRQPLHAGTRYDVLATVNGRDYKWSFEVAR
jgi:uncharacterized protein YkwD